MSEIWVWDVFRNVVLKGKWEGICRDGDVVRRF